MKLFSVPIAVNINAIHDTIVKTIKAQFLLYKDDYKYLIKIYNEDNIYSAISDIYFNDKDKSFYAPVSGINGQILRMLEYGGVQTKAHKLLSKVSRIISRKVNGESYVF